MYLGTKKNLAVLAMLENINSLKFTVYKFLYGSRVLARDDKGPSNAFELIRFQKRSIYVIQYSLSCSLPAHSMPAHHKTRCSTTTISMALLIALSIPMSFHLRDATPTSTTHFFLPTHRKALTS